MQIDTVLLPHADADHFGGISVLLSNKEVRVDHVLLNPNDRETELWRDFVSVMRDAKERGVALKLELSEQAHAI